MKLEEISLWFNYKKEVWPTNEPQTAIVHNSMRLLRCIQTCFEYVSTPITSGKYLYDNPNANMDEVIAMNYNLGCDFIEKLKLRTKDLIFPADLVPTDHFSWEQKHFQSQWLSVIAEKCHTVHMNRDWEYSNGCTEELVHTFQLRLGVPKHNNLIFFNTKEIESESRERMKNIKVYDYYGIELTPEKSLKLINYSIAYIKAKSKKANLNKLINAKNCLEKTIELINEGFYQ